MYVHKKILEKVTQLFTDEPYYRDERWETIVKITNVIKDEFKITNEMSMIKVAFDVDRAFRYVQQHDATLRGKTWLKRQKQAGEIPPSDEDGEWCTLQISLF